jgi:hypothetical protein
MKQMLKSEGEALEFPKSPITFATQSSTSFVLLLLLFKVSIACTLLIYPH